MVRRVVALALVAEAGEPPTRVDELLVDGEGVLGDRYREGRGRWSLDRTSPLTLVATGEVAAAAEELGVDLDPLALRRNVVVEGATLADLVGRRFSLGGALLQGERPCDPCRYLEDLLGLAGLKAALAGRGGLRARVVTGGTIRTGDALEIDPGHILQL